MRRKDYYFLRKGFYDKLKYEKILMRQAAILAGGIAYAKNPEDFVNRVFPIQGEELQGLTIEEIRRRKAWYKAKTQQKK